MQDTPKKQPRKYPNSILEKFKIPQRIMHTFTEDAQRRKITIWEEMYPSSRARNGLYVVKNKASFEKRSMGEMSLRKNEPTPDWEISMSTRSRGRGGQEIKFFLKHADFEYVIPVDFKTFESLIDECNIEHGVIKDALVFTSQGLMLAEKAQDIEVEAQEYHKEVQVNKEALKKDKYTKKTIRIGDVAIVHGTSSNIRVIYLGETDSPEGKLNMFASINNRDFRAIERAYLEMPDHLAHPMYSSVRNACTNLVHMTDQRPAANQSPARMTTRYESYNYSERRSSYRVSRKKIFGPFWKLPSNDALSGCNIIDAMLREGTPSEQIQELFKAFMIPSSVYTQQEKTRRDMALNGSTTFIGLTQTIEQFQEDHRIEKETHGTPETAIS